jgi:pimeloyl-ACP methyl ester carboxylesterase
MNTVTSADGTSIAFDREGHGPALIIVGGGPTTRSAQGPLAGLLAPQYSVYNYDRRGHGESGDTAPYAPSREYEDLEAIIDLAGGTAHVYGTSGGAILALQAAAHGLAITKLAVWEPPYIVPNSRPPVPADYPQQLTTLLAQGRRADLLELFFTAAVGMPTELVTPIRQSPFWAASEKLAHTLIYDAMLTGDFSIPTAQLATIVIPHPRHRRRHHPMADQIRPSPHRHPAHSKTPHPDRSTAQPRPSSNRTPTSRVLRHLTRYPRPKRDADRTNRDATDRQEPT